MYLLSGTAAPVQAAVYVGEVPKHQIFFVLDCSHSMAEEKWQEAVDSVAMIAAMLPSDYETAVMAYNEEIAVCTDFGETLDSQLEELRKVVQKGYTNTGLAVETALERFSADSSGEKRIVVISDGEISMKSQEETDAAVLLYEDAARNAAAENVKIDILLFETEEFEEQISDGAEITKGFFFRKTDINTVDKFAEAYLFEQLELERIMLGASDTLEHAADISLQDIFADKVKLLLLAESKMENIQVNCQCADAQIVRGEQFAVIELKDPLEENVALQYTLAQTGEINAYLVKEYNLSVEMEADYDEETLRHIITVCIKDSKDRSILTDEDICEKIDFYINGVKTDYAVEHGNAVIPYPIEETEEILLKVDFSRLNSLVFCNAAEGKLLLELPPPEPEEQDNTQYFWLCAVVSGVCIIFVLLLLLLWLAKKKTKKGTAVFPPSQDTEEVKYDFSGKLAVYLLKNANGEDMPPASVNLYKRVGKEPFSFAWVKDKCRMDMNLKDADKILFSGGKNHALCIRNNGDATLFNGRDILLRGKKYTLNYNEKLLMIFNGGEIEVEIHYKNIKPSERER